MTSASFDQVNEDHLSALLDLAPEVGTELNRVERDDRWAHPTPDVRAQVLTCLRNWSKALDSHPEALLSVGQRLDRKVFRSHLELVEFAHAEIPTFKHDPDLLSSVARTLVRQWHADGVPEEQRYSRLHRRLEALEDYLGEFRPHIQDPDRVWQEAAEETALGMPALISALRQAAEQSSIPTSLKADMDKSASQASRAVEAQLAWIRGLSPSTSAHRVLGRERLAQVCRLRLLDTSDPDEMLEVGRRYVVEYLAERRRFGKRLDPEDPVKGALTHLKQDAPRSFQEALSRVEEAVHAARAFVQGQDLCPLPEGESLLVQETPASLRALHPHALALGAPRLAKQQKGLLLLSAPALDGNVADLHQCHLEGVAIHFGYPGHHLQQTVANMGTGLLRHGVPLGHYAPACAAWGQDMAEGWSHYCEFLMREQGFRDHNQARVQLAQSGLAQAHALLVDVGLATGSLSEEAAASTLTAELGLSPLLARAEVRRSFIAPGLGLAGLLGKEQLFDLRTRAKVAWRGDFSLRRFHELVLSTGSVPLQFVAHRIEPENAPD